MTKLPVRIPWLVVLQLILSWQLSLAEETAAPTYHVVVKGDTLWDIAGIYLKRPTSWPKIWDMNKSAIKNPHRIYPNQKVLLAPDQIEEAPPAAETAAVPATAPAETPPEPIPTPAPEKDSRASVAVSEPTGKPVLREIGKIVAVKKKIKPSGKISGSDEEKFLLETGDVITIKFHKAKNLPPGTICTVFRRQEYFISPSGEYADEEQSAVQETIGAVELTQNLSAKRCVATVIAVSAPLVIGDSIQIWESSAQ